MVTVAGALPDPEPEVLLGVVLDPQAASANAATALRALIWMVLLEVRERLAIVCLLSV